MRKNLKWKVWKPEKLNNIQTSVWRWSRANVFWESFSFSNIRTRNISDKPVMPFSKSGCFTTGGIGICKSVNTIILTNFQSNLTKLNFRNQIFIGYQMEKTGRKTINSSKCVPESGSKWIRFWQLCLNSKRAHKFLKYSNKIPRMPSAKFKIKLSKSFKFTNLIWSVKNSNESLKWSFVLLDNKLINYFPLICLTLNFWDFTVSNLG